MAEGTRKLGLSTTAIHGGAAPSAPGTGVSSPIVQSVNYAQEPGTSEGLLYTRYGKIGANGQVTVKKLASDADAKALHDKLVGEKTKKGYAEGGGKPAKANGKAAAKPAKNGKASKAVETDDAEPEVIVIPEGGCRLEVVEGKSAKFWQIVRNEKVVTVTFGKIAIRAPYVMAIRRFDKPLARASRA